MSDDLLHDLDAARGALVATLATRAAGIHTGRRRSCGVVWQDRWLIAAADAIGEADRVRVRLDDGEHVAEVAALEPRTDVAVLRLPEPRTVVAPLPGMPSLGEAVVLVGREAAGPTAAWGTVRLAGPAWTSRRGGEIDRRLELDLRLDPATEGAAVATATGALAGIAVPGPRGRVLCIPAATIARTLATVVAHGRLPRPYLGLRLQAVRVDRTTSERLALDAATRSVAVVTGLEPDAPAVAAGVEIGDWLVAVDGRACIDGDGLPRAVAARRPGDTLRVEARRAGRPLTLELRVGDRPTP